MNKLSPVAKQAAGKLWSGFPWPDRANKENAKIIQQAIDTATAKLREELEQTRENLYAGLDRDRDDITTPHLATVAVNALALAREELAQVRGDACKLLAFANLVEPYVSNDHCHGKNELDHKLYDACFEIRPLIAKWTRSYIEGEQLAHQQPSATTAEPNCVVRNKEGQGTSLEYRHPVDLGQPLAPTADENNKKDS